MTPYVMKYVTKEEYELFEKIKKIVLLLPNIDFGIDEDGKKILLSCHILARVVGKVFHLKYVDGIFYPNFLHSWVLTSIGSHIIDVYPIVTLGGPIMIVQDNNNVSPIRLNYLSTNNTQTYGDMFSRQSFQDAIKQTETVLRKYL